VDPLWIAVAFVLGFAARQVGLPPLVGFLVAGFVLNAFGAESGEALQHIADLGVTLLLFSIGCKLRIRGLLRRARSQAVTADRVRPELLQHGLRREGARGAG
jgi:predicted Kef-type K+ transport protein